MALFKSTINPKMAEDAPIPEHIAIVMDGNGRWAKKRFLPRIMGHKRGVDSFLEMMDVCQELGVKFLTVFAFSTENWKRPSEEVSFLMHLFMKTLKRHVQRLHERNMRLKVIGEHALFSPELHALFLNAEELTALNTGLTVTVAVNYGGRADILTAAQRYYAAHPQQVGQPLDEASFTPYLSMAYAPDPDLFIRTGGETRISNFLIWQMSYSELYFTDTLWPDFNRASLLEAMTAFQGRERRFGRISEQLRSSADA